MIPARPSAALLLAILLCLGAIAGAQSTPWTLDGAVDAALLGDSDLSSLQLDLEAAERDLRRATLDPLATGQERLAAGHAVAAAQSDLAGAAMSLRIAVLQAYAGVLEAQDALAAATGQLEVAQREAEAAQVRFGAGAITEAALVQARSAADAASRRQRDAATTLDLAWSDLADLLGVAVSTLHEAGLSGLAEEPPMLPDLDADLQAVVLQHASVAAAERNLATAHAQLAAVDHEASSPNQVADARTAVEAAQRRLDDARRSAAQGLRSAHQAWLSASERLSDARQDVATAATTFEAQSVRHQVGELSPIAFLQAELALAASEASLHSAMHAAHLAWWRYLQAQAGD